ncbi:MAG: peptide chain release factor 1 [Candidatus Sumerlaeota bacterium]
MDFEKQCREIEETFQQIEASMADQELLADQEKYREVAKRHAELGRILEQWRKYQDLKDSLEQARALIEDDDPDMAEMAREEVESSQTALEKTEQRLMQLLLPKDPMDEKNIVMEVRAGTGGEEAALFAGDLVRAYTRYFETKGWKMEFLSSSPTELGGFKEAIFAVSGDSVYSHMKFESGTHRVQRVQSTETQGRIHTSAITVAVLPEASEVDVEIKNEDIRIDVFRSSGPGGQSVNTTDSAVRITHEPTGLVVSCQDEKSQHKNRAKALKVLRSRLLELEIRKQQEAESAERREQVGTGDRSGRIRTYNFPQNRLSDHRIGLTLHQLDQVMEGNFSPVIEALQADEMHKRLESAGQL